MADPVFLHDHKDFFPLLRIVAEEKDILPGLVEKDYWIMHVLYGLKDLGYEFELKGGTSLSKGYQIIDRFSEDIDIHIKPPPTFNINESPKNIRKSNIMARKKFYDWLASDIKVPGIFSQQRDEVFDDTKYYRSGGIRLFYNSYSDTIEGVKEGILLEVGFDTVTPNSMITISSWAYEKAILSSGIDIIDNRAKNIKCYHPGYTLVEKLQTIATKFRKEQDGDFEHPNFMRQYYDVYALLSDPEVCSFIGSDEYYKHKKTRFPMADYETPIRENEAFLLRNPVIKSDFINRYKNTASLYYKGQPPFESILEKIAEHLEKM